MAITESIQWREDGKAHSLSRNADCKAVFVYQRGDSLPQFFSTPEAYALAIQIRRMVVRSELVLASKQWRSK